MVNNMENTEEVMQILERFTRQKQKEIPKELDEYLQYVAKTGDTVFKWSSLKYLFREKLLNVIKHFHDTTQRVDEIPQYPNVDPFNYESMKASLLERLDLFNAAPFTVQRLCELLIDPRKQYSRIDKFMRALEKNILVVSTIEPGRKRTESENGDSLDSVVNGDLSLDVNVDIDMENESLFNLESQNNSNDNGGHAIVEIITDNLKVKETVSETSNVLRNVDEDILPNPKKAKLDLEFEEEIEKSDNNENKYTAEQNAANVVNEADISKTKSVPNEDNVDNVVKAEKEKVTKLQIEENDTSYENKLKVDADKDNTMEKATVEDVPEKIVEQLESTPKQEEGKGNSSELKPENDDKNNENTLVIEKIIEKDVIEKSEKEQNESDNEVINAKEDKSIKLDDSNKQSNKQTSAVNVKDAIESNAVTEIHVKIDKDISKETPISNSSMKENESSIDKPNEDKDAIACDKEQKEENSIKSAITQSDKTDIEDISTKNSILQENVVSTINSISQTDTTLVSEAITDGDTAKCNNGTKSVDSLTTSEQPMEQGSAPIDEIMAEATNTATDVMSTDIGESGATKDEPAGMEIDDTSQEAMDQ